MKSTGAVYNTELFLHDNVSLFLRGIARISQVCSVLFCSDLLLYNTIYYHHWSSDSRLVLQGFFLYFSNLFIVFDKIHFGIFLCEPFLFFSLSTIAVATNKQTVLWGQPYSERRCKTIYRCVITL